jgi:acetyl-CoA synthetase
MTLMTGTDVYWRHRRTATNHTFRRARDLLLELRTEPERAAAAFEWPRDTSFNWALEWFDVMAAGHTGTALELLPADGPGPPFRLSFAELSARSDTVACWLRDRGVARGDRVLVVVDARPSLWETLLACLKLGAVVIPCHVGLTSTELGDRVRRGRADHVVCLDRVAHDAARAPASAIRGLRVLVGSGEGEAELPAGWSAFPGAEEPARPFLPVAGTPADAVAFAYFTSGTTSTPKLVAHSHRSYPVGHLSSMYWNGLLPGDRHLNVSSPGWAKHSWSSLFVPWNAEATVVAPAAGPVLPARLPGLLERYAVNTLCAPPSTWRALLPFLDDARPALREATSAGEPLDPTVADRVEATWGVRPRDGYGQTETSALVGTTPGQRAPRGALGRPLPGYRLVLRERYQDTPEREHAVGPGVGSLRGELCIDLVPQPAGVMLGYLEESATPRPHTDVLDGRPVQATGDLAEVDADGWLRLLGRDDDMFKSFDRRISPLELEAVLSDHPSVFEVAVIPLPHPVGGHVPHAVVVPRRDVEADARLAPALLAFAAARVTAELRPRSVGFATSLPRTVTGKVNRSALRALLNWEHTNGPG